MKKVFDSSGSSWLYVRRNVRCVHIICRSTAQAQIVDWILPLPQWQCFIISSLIAIILPPPFNPSNFVPFLCLCHKNELSFLILLPLVSQFDQAVHLLGRETAPFALHFCFFVPQHSLLLLFAVIIQFPLQCSVRFLAH